MSRENGRVDGILDLWVPAGSPAQEYQRKEEPAVSKIPAAVGHGHRLEAPLKDEKYTLRAHVAGPGAISLALSLSCRELQDPVMHSSRD